MMSPRRTALALSLGLPLAACAPEPEVTRTDAVRGSEVYAANCTVCHGTEARGDGPGAAGLTLAPPNLRLIAQRNGGAFPHDRVASTIDGYTRTAEGAAMPAFGAGDLGPLVQVEDDGVSTPYPADLLALTNYLESIQE